MLSKKIIPLLTIFLFVFFSYGQQISHQKSELTNRLIVVNKTKENTELMVKKVLAMYKSKYPNVSFMTWGSIESNVNYKGYYAKVMQIYRSNYTDAEIKQLIKLYNPKTMDKYTAKTKKVEQQLYNAGKEFGKELSVLINSKMK